MSNWKGWAAAGVGRSVFLDAAHETGSWGAGIESSSGRDLWVSVDLGGGTMLDYSRAETVEFSSASANSHVSIGHHLTIATSAYRMWEHTPGDEEIVWTTMSILPRYSLSDRSYLRLSAQGIDASNWGGSWYDRAWLDINLLLCHRWRNLTLQGGWNRSGTWNEGEWAILTKASVRTWL